MSILRRPLAALLPVLALAALLAPASAQAATYRFVGLGTDPQNWQDANNWSPVGVPGAGDDVTIKQNPGGPAHVVLHAPVTVRSVDLEAGGSVADQSITVTGGLTWLGGGVLTSMTLPAGSVSTVAGTDPKSLGDGVEPEGLTVAGSLDLGGSGVMSVWEGDSLTSSDTLTIEPGFALHGIACCVTPAHLVSTGTLSLPGPSTATILGVGVEASGVVATSPGEELDLTGEPVQLDAGLAVSGGGLIALTGTQNAVLGGTVNLASGTTLEVGTSADLSGTGTITGTGTLDWTAGRIIGNVTVGSSARLIVEGSGSKSLVPDEGGAGKLTVDGPSSIDAPAVLSMTNSTLTNVGTMTLAAGSAIHGGVCCVSPAKLLNTGMLIGDAGGGTASIAFLAFTSSGTVDAHAGTLEIDTIDPVQTRGTTLLDGGTLGSDHTFQLKKGKLEGVGTIAAAVNNVGATVMPGDLTKHATGVLTITRSYTQGVKGFYKPDVEGAAAGSGYDQLAVGGTATLGGTVAISTGKKFAPAAGSHVSVLTAATRTGTFATVTGTLIPSGGSWTVSYLATGADLVAGP
jgi:hypothetical protein